MRRVKRLDEGVRLRVEDEDDLWVLSKICRKGSSVGMLSHRRDSTTGTKEDGRAKSAERKPMWIVLDAHEAAFQSFTDNLRVHGVIKEAKIDIGSHHTHIVSPGDEVEISRDGGLERSDLDLIAEAISSGTKAKAGLIVVESDEILVFEVTSRGIRDVSQFSMRGGGKRVSDPSSVRNAFFEDVAREVGMVFADEMPLVICGPGMARERFEKGLRDTGSKNTVTNAPTSIGGRSAANEVLSEGAADAILGEHVLVKEIRAIEEALRRVSVNGAVTYGMSLISDAASQGAVESLIIDASMIREGDETTRSRWESICEEIKSSRGEVIQASVDHDAGQQLLGMGGAIALLRWKLDH
tara:strand:- start:7896 stop:8957 length:1062 start_codon:yes stop_codon:yes gene_type:complete